MADESLRHVFIKNTEREMDFTSKQRGGPKLKFPTQNRFEHGNTIKQKFEDAWRQARELDEQRRAVSLLTKDGVYLEFESSPEYELATKSLEDVKHGIRLLNVKTDIIDDEIINKATVFIPQGKEKIFLKKVQDYLNDEKNTKKNNPKNQPLIDSLNDLNLAVLESFWQGKKEWIPGEEPKWCEIWLSDDSDEVVNQFRDLAENQLKIPLQQESIKFPERCVLLGQATRSQLQELITASPHIAEFRRASETADLFMEMENQEQTEWAQDLLDRLEVDEESNVCICILDTGINNGHILLNRIINDQDCRSYNPLWGVDDHAGHGTQMSGLAGYGDLQSALESSSPISILHRLESIKILPPKGENDPKLYGAIVAQSVSDIIIDNPERQRIICMAVTAPEYSTRDGSPSSWSAALDEFTSGYLDEQRKIMFVSAGNVDEMDDWRNYPDSNKTKTVQNPGQAWNVITVGAYTEKAEVDTTKYNGSKAVASAGELSPFSSTSYSWDNKWPIKPDIVLEGGNLIQDSFSCCSCSEFDLLTLHHKPTERQFSTIRATSAATAQAAWMAAQIQAEYPEAWSETIRALMIHSAEWTPEMQRQFLTGDSKGNYQELLRICGYGVPNLARALWCLRNSVNLIVQTELQPYDKKSDGGFKTKDMHIHKLPWPKEILLDLAETPITLKVTLSYFIEPGPGEIGWKNRYRYPSCLLRFDVNGTDTEEAFLNRINAATIDEENEMASDGGSVKWTLGKQNRHLGSIHSDTWHTTAAQLATSNLIGIYPAVGWWRERAWINKWNHKIRYALVVSLHTPEQSVDLYTPITAQIKIPVPIEV